MSQVDVIFKQTLESILSKEWEEDHRAVWEDGSPVKTKRELMVVNEYDLSKEFPAGTLRPVAFKTCFREVDWIYRKRSSNVNDFDGKIWDSWADESGSIGKAYGHQVAKPVMGYDNQMDFILGEIQKNPTSRRLVIEMWNVDDYSEMNLPPCAHHLQFFVQDGTLHLLLKQRSNDFMVAGNFNVCEYALLAHMVARHCGLQIGTLKHIIGDCHIYNKHEEQALEILTREPLPAPVLWINPEKHDFYSFTEDDFKLLDYQNHTQLKMEVAI